MEKKLNTVGGILFAILEIIIGIIILVKPLEFTNLIFNCFGVVLIIFGIVNCISYFINEKEIAIIEQSLTKGLLGLVVGIFLIVCKDWIISIVPIISVIYGIIILFGAVRKIQTTIDLIRLDQTFWAITLIEAIVSVILAIVIFKNPFVLATTLWIFVGISVIIEGIFNLVASVYMFSIREKYNINQD